MRKLFGFKTLKKPVRLFVLTKSPTKWLLIDRETGQVFQGSDNGYWDRLDPAQRQEDERDQ